MYIFYNFICLNERKLLPLHDFPSCALVSADTSGAEVSAIYIIWYAREVMRNIPFPGAVIIKDAEKRIKNKKLRECL